MKKISVEHIARVEGHGNIYVEIENGRARKVEMRVVEGSRMFEAFLRGRNYVETPEIASRVCAICSASHLIASIKAIEDAVGVQPDEQTVLLRKLAIMGETIQSHVLHIYLLALPDYLGYPSVVHMVKEHGEAVKKALEMKKLGNDMAEVVGGRAVHLITPMVGGLTYVPKKSHLHSLKKRVLDLLPWAEKTVEIFGGLENPPLERKTEYIALYDPEEFCFYGGEKTVIRSSEGWTAPINRYREYITEAVVPYSTAKFGVRNGHGFMVGALARLNLNYDHLCDEAKEAVEKTPIRFPATNPFLNNFAQAVETLHCFHESIRILDDLECMDLREKRPEMDMKKHGWGHSAVEAPRGTLYHSYLVNEKGIVEEADIITPTAQNWKNLEEDIEALVPLVSDRGYDEIQMAIEMNVRAYDPCISCSTHVTQVKKR